MTPTVSAAPSGVPLRGIRISAANTNASTRNGADTLGVDWRCCPRGRYRPLGHPSRWIGKGGTPEGPELSVATYRDIVRLGCIEGASIRARSAVRIAVRVRYGGEVVRHGHGKGGLGVHAGGDGVG